MRLCLPFLLLLLAAFTAQAQRVVVVPSPSKAAAPANEQVYSLLCEQTTAECVDAKAVMTQKKLDWKKIKKQKIKWVVTTQYKTIPAKQKGKPAQKRLTVVAQEASSQKTRLKPVYPLLASSGMLSSQNAAKLSQTFSKTLKLKPAAGPLETSQPLAQRVPQEEALHTPTLDLRTEETEPPVQTKMQEEPPPLVEEKLPPPAKTPSPYPIFAFELGLHFFNHKHEFVNLSTDNLRSFKAGIQAAPALRAEFYPLAFGDLGLASGIGLDFGLSMGLGLKTKDELSRSFPMKWSSLDGGLRWRLQFSKTWRAAVTPMFGIQRTSLSHGTLNGVALNGFPPLGLTSLRIGVGFELPFASDWVVVFGDFSILPVLSAKDILASPYFPEGSAFGFEGKLGIGIKIVGPLYVRFSGFASRTNFKLNAAPGSTYVADTAYYQRIGAQLGLAVSF